jgi:NDP-sugar pyrophosphorylase family protein
MNIVIPMAGSGSRFQQLGIKDPKPLIRVLDKTLIEYSIDSFNVSGRFIFITRKFENPADNIKLSELLKSKRPESIEIQLTSITSGATETALYARNLIDNDEPLVIYNCDQFINWDANNFLQFLDEKKPDSVVVLFNNSNSKYSFAKIENGIVTQLVEKKVISNHALTGFHYWSKGKNFVNSADTLIEKFRENGSPECYISETFNYLTNQTILPYHIDNHLFSVLGTPEDVSRYISERTVK